MDVALLCPHCGLPLEHTPGWWYSAACGASFGQQELEVAARLLPWTPLAIWCPAARGASEFDARIARVRLGPQGDTFLEHPCPGCDEPVACRLDGRSALRLIALGMTKASARPPAEVVEIVEELRLGSDELLAEHVLVGRRGWLEHLERGLGTSSAWRSR